jgi:hypothetical protein
MSTHTSTHQPPRSEQPSTQTVDAHPDRREVAGHREHSRSRPASGPRPAASRRVPPPPAAGQRLTTTYIQGDFATGQRTLPLPVTPVGTFANR